MEHINTEEIMSEIRAEIKKKGYTDKILSFDDIGEFTDAQGGYNSQTFSFDELTFQVNQMNAQYNVAEYRIYPNVGVGNKVKALIKKLLRKPIRFYINPIVNDQNEFNASVVRAANQLRFYVAENQKLQAKIEALAQEVEELRSSQINNLED